MKIQIKSDAFKGYRVDRSFKHMEIFVFCKSSKRLISRWRITMNKGLTLQQRFQEVCHECREHGLKKPAETWVK